MHLDDETRQQVKRFMDVWDFVPFTSNETSPHRNVYSNEHRDLQVIVTASRKVYLAKTRGTHVSSAIASVKLKGAECTTLV